MLRGWSKRTGLGSANLAPGLIFDDDEDVVPDVTWASNERLALALSKDGKLHAAPELVVEVLSAGAKNERRDRQAKLKLYSRHGVAEYWILDWRSRNIEIYRRKEAQLELIATSYEGDLLTSPLLPGFSCKVTEIFEDVPPVAASSE